MLLHERLKSYHIILASHSPRRQQLLQDAGIEYELAEGYDVEEIFPADMAIEDVPEYLSTLKSHAYPKTLDRTDIVITADTVVCLEGRIIGKPADREDAIAILQSLSGQRHTVVTGVTLRTFGLEKSFSVHSNVFFRSLALEEIEFYIDTCKPFDKAGAYGIQEWIGYVGIERIEGSFYNVMGLPIQQLYLKLRDFIDRMEGKS